MFVLPYFPPSSGRITASSEVPLINDHETPEPHDTRIPELEGEPARVPEKAASLREADPRHHRVLDLAGAGLCVFDVQGRATSVNDPALQMLGQAAVSAPR